MTRDDRIKAEAERWSPILKPLTPYEAAERIMQRVPLHPEIDHEKTAEAIAGALLAIAAAQPYHGAVMWHEAQVRHYREYTAKYSDLDGDRAAAKAAMHEQSAAALRRLAPQPDDGWQPIETAPPDQVCDFWLEWAKGCGPGKPLGETKYARHQRFRGRLLTWPSIYQATHWRSLPAPPAGER